MTRKQKKILKALRSDEYVQGRQTMCVPAEGGDRFCCLGVIVNELHPGEWEEASYSIAGFPQLDSRLMFRGFGGDLPISLMSEVELTNRLMRHLIEMNDVDKKTFLEIADWLEKVWTQTAVDTSA